MRIVSLVLLVCVGQVVYASVISDTAEKEALCTRIRQAQSEIRNLLVKSDLVREYGPVVERQSEEWGFSGEKLFLKSQWPSKSDEPVSSRFQIGIWDGTYYKLYDTQTQSGSLRDSYNPRSAASVPFHLTSIYARFLGTYSEGTLTQLLNEGPLEAWTFEPNESDSTLCVSLDMGSIIDKWWLDPGRHYMVQRHEVTGINRKTNEIKTRVVTEAVEAKEVQPGIWLPTRISAVGTHHDRPTPTKTQMVVQEIKVNDPETERVFDWQFPTDGTYYDYTIGRAVHPGRAAQAVQGGIAETADDTKTMSSKREEANDPENKLTADRAASSSTSDTAAREGNTPNDKMPTGRHPARLGGLVAFLALAGALAAVLFIRKKR
jgi:hypothetical protein